MTTSRHAGLYVRISSDPTGARLGVKRQAADCTAKAAALGWQITELYEDNDKSASTGKSRPAYQRMLADVEAGRINAVIVWDLDRLTRRPIEVEQFIDIADRHHVALASVGGDVDLATDNGRMFARIKGAVARAEVERKSTRQCRANLQRAEAGRPGGGRRPFGYSRDRMATLEVEAAEVRKAAEALLAGSSVRGIVAGLNARSVTTTSGGPWRPTELRRMLANPRYAGLVVHRGEVIGKGKWPPILDEDTFHSVRAVLSDPTRHKAGPPRRYLLSGLAHCNVCGGRLFGVTEKGKGALYRCESRRHVNTKADPVDDMILQLVAARLAQPDAVDLLAPPERADEARALRDEDADVRARLDGLAEAYAANEIDRRQLRAGSERLHRRLDKITGDLARVAQTSVLTSIVTADDVSFQVKAMYLDDLDRLRSIVSFLVEITLTPPGRGARTFDPRTVGLTWRS